MTLPERIFLVDRRPLLVRAWSEVFASFDWIEPIEGDFFEREADAMLSPANSFGIMDGGLDAAIRAMLGGTIEGEVQAMIVARHHGELPVGVADLVSTGHERWPWLVVAPTMRIPQNIAQTLNAYLSFRAALLAVVDHNQRTPGAPIRTLLAPGCGTGIGGMDTRRCAAQMRVALDHVRRPPRIPSFALIHEVHEKMRTAQ